MLTRLTRDEIAAMDVIAFDLDGVLADVCFGIAAIYGLPEDWRPHQYDLQPLLNTTSEEMFERIKRTRRFWIDLPPINEGVVLARWVSEINPRVYIITARPEDWKCYSETTQWVGYVLPRLKRRVIWAKEKFRFAGSRRVLIDDYDKQIEPWKEAGGYGLLLKQPWSPEGSSWKEIFDAWSVPEEVRSGHGF